MNEQTFDEILDEINQETPIVNAAAAISGIDAMALEAAIKRDEAMLRLRSIELASEYQRARMALGNDKHGGDLIRLASGIHSWVTKGEKTSDDS